MKTIKIKNWKGTIFTQNSIEFIQSGMAKAALTNINIMSNKDKHIKKDGNKMTEQFKDISKTEKLSLHYQNRSIIF